MQIYECMHRITIFHLLVTLSEPDSSALVMRHCQQISFTLNVSWKAYSSSEHVSEAWMVA